ncbi:hypothetical protein OESDEN_05835 [Oesophagostomum dentatum]|uniref:Uncharacterized protein n=1 Tax=Oesophagostomum dentatum TaxID=61180 RepID=A0A0B1T9L3_OESDE|nr:hypothetical protein OESDEN_05835 [Oesophagostomum dentatum]
MQTALESVRSKANKSDVEFYYEKLNLFSNYEFLYYNGDAALFEGIVEEVLKDSKGTPFEDLVKFNIANLVNKQILYYLAIKKDLFGPEKRHLNSQDRRQLEKAMQFLEDSIIPQSVAFAHVRYAMDMLKNYGDVYRTIQQEEDWITGKIGETLHKIASS